MKLVSTENNFTSHPCLAGGDAYHKETTMPKFYCVKTQYRGREVEQTLSICYSKSKPRNVYQERGDYDRYYDYFYTEKDAIANMEEFQQLVKASRERNQE
jgi:hypothetical protein